MSTHHNQFAYAHFRWDVDKTYIHTDFDSLRSLIKTWRQGPEDKRNIPGAPALLRELLRTQDEHQVTFISGSPRQMRNVLLKKFALDGIEPNQFILKPNLSNVLTLRIRDIHNQIGYKLRALLDSRIAERSEYLFGDDSEQDGLIYSLYSDLLAGKIAVDQLQEFLEIAGLYRSEVERIVQAYIELTPHEGVVERVFIHLDRRSPVARFDAFGWRVVPVYNYFQAAIVLFDMHMLDADSLCNILVEMRSHGYDAARLANSLQDLVRRGYATRNLVKRVCDALDKAPSGTEISFQRAFMRALKQLPRASHVRKLPQAIPDYRTLFEAERYRRQPRTFPAPDWLIE